MFIFIEIKDKVKEIIYRNLNKSFKMKNEILVEKFIYYFNIFFDYI